MRIAELMGEVPPAARPPVLCYHRVGGPLEPGVTRVASAIFALFAVGHVVRLVKQAQVTVGTHQIPMSLSVVALIIAAILSIWLWRLSSARP